MFVEHRDFEIAVATGSFVLRVASVSRREDGTVVVFAAGEAVSSESHPESSHSPSGDFHRFSGD